MATLYHDAKTEISIARTQLALGEPVDAAGLIDACTAFTDGVFDDLRRDNETLEDEIKELTSQLNDERGENDDLRDERDNWKAAFAALKHAVKVAENRLRLMGSDGVADEIVKGIVDAEAIGRGQAPRGRFHEAMAKAAKGKRKKKS